MDVSAQELAIPSLPESTQGAEVVTGRCESLLPDGRLQTVTYTCSPLTGYKAVVHYHKASNSSGDDKPMMPLTSISKETATLPTTLSPTTSASTTSPTIETTTEFTAGTIITTTTAPQIIPDETTRTSTAAIPTESSRFVSADVTEAPSSAPTLHPNAPAKINNNPLVSLFTRNRPHPAFRPSEAEIVASKTTEAPAPTTSRILMRMSWNLNAQHQPHNRH